DQVLGGVSLHSLDSGRADGHAGGKIGLADIAVLYRTDVQAGPLGQALTRAGLPFQKRSHDLLCRRTAVPDIVPEMRLAGAADLTLTGAARTRGGGAQESGSAHQGGGAQDSGGCQDGRGAQEAVSVADRLNAAVRLLTGRPLAGSALDGRRRGMGAVPEAASSVDVMAAAEVLTPLARRCGDDFERFLTEINLGAEADALDPRADAVPLLTLHAAKGLEYSVVFVAGCERGLLPLWLPGSRGSDSRGPDPAEERRVVVVGGARGRAPPFPTLSEGRRRVRVVSETGPGPLLAAPHPPPPCDSPPP